ncbi:vWA domain-containing protein [Virgibacillus doumboii]|uniref:vWA domain-containing protein n=1 Tax=Virgibacillus doumboii TaxID=2697503 RepID=UPI0013E002AC|nr:VWA domain-containing protein [Virgibacillus doumboii]
MKKNFTYFLILLFSLMLILSGCSNDEQAKDENKDKTEASEQPEEKKEKITVPEAATEAEEMVKEGPGELFTSAEMSPEELKEAFKDLPKELTADKAYNHLIHLLAADYGPALKEYENFNPSFLTGDAPEGSENKEKAEEPKKLHVALLMDASGSMGAYVGGEMKMKAAKDSLKKFAADLPKDAKMMLRVYGHKGTGSDADKEMSCSSTEVVYQMGAYNKKKFNKALSKFKPAGWTPLAASINAAKKDLEAKSGDDVKNVVYIISDGEETCGGDPVQAAKNLHDSGIATAVNIIGFDVGNKAQQQLKKVAEAGGGTFTNVDSGNDIFEAAQNNIREAVEAAELNMWSALEGVDLTWDSIHKNDDLDSIRSGFGEVIEDENSLLLDGLEGLEQTGKVTEDVAEEVEALIEERQEKLEQFNEDKEANLEERIKEEEEKARDLIEKKKEQRSSD